MVTARAAPIRLGDNLLSISHANRATHAAAPNRTRAGHPCLSIPRRMVHSGVLAIDIKCPKARTINALYPAVSNRNVCNLERSPIASRELAVGVKMDANFSTKILQ